MAKLMAHGASARACEVGRFEVERVQECRGLGQIKEAWPGGFGCYPVGPSPSPQPTLMASSSTAGGAPFPPEVYVWNQKQNGWWCLVCGKWMEGSHGESLDHLKRTDPQWLAYNLHHAKHPVDFSTPGSGWYRTRPGPPPCPVQPPPAPSASSGSGVPSAMPSAGHQPTSTVAEGRMAALEAHVQELTIAFNQRVVALEARVFELERFQELDTRPLRLDARLYELEKRVQADDSRAYAWEARALELEGRVHALEQDGAKLHEGWH